ncbi:3-hydroxyacyl-CoA dehydrogenase family protein [Salicibibacter cibi]|nr:3-hydroxyacyl-CoA dehydrogenase family protein [Salicibibacter cibi]
MIFFTTSKINSVNYIASLTEDPKKVVGLQFIGYFESIKIVELIKGIHTSQKTLMDAQNILKKMDKEVIILKDSPGFMINRLVFTLINESIHLLNEGIGTPKNIDDEMELGMGMAIGPLKLADKIGLDNTLKILHHLYEETGNNKYLPCPLLKNMVNAGYVGVKSNVGFFNYSAEILDFPIFNT